MNECLNTLPTGVFVQVIELDVALVVNLGRWLCLSRIQCHPRLPVDLIISLSMPLLTHYAFHISSPHFMQEPVLANGEASTNHGVKVSA